MIPYTVLGLWIKVDACFVWIRRISIRTSVIVMFAVQYAADVASLRAVCNYS